MVGRALPRAHHSSVWTASSLRVFMYGHGEHFCSRTAHHFTCVLGIPMVDGSVRYGSVLPFLQRHGVRARTVRCPGSVAWCARSNCRVVLVMYADHERCVCALLCASGVALHNLCGFETIQNFSGEWMIIYHRGLGVRARLHTPGDRRAGSHPASSRDILLTSEPGLGLAILRLGARLDRLSSSGTCEESTRGDPCCGPLAFTCSPRRVSGASRTPSTQLSWGHGAAHKLPSQPR